MASRIATSARVGLVEIDRQTLPSTIGDARPDLLGLITGMGLMAGSTGSTSSVLVDVQKMKILVAISKIRQVFGLGRLNQRLFMALKTQVKLRLFKRGIEFCRIRLGQHPEIVTAMG